MTRVNADLDPRTLKRLHLLAELREITMVPAALRRSLRTIEPNDIKKNIPKKFVLSTGHVRFFYDKLTFLINRFFKLIEEMERRGFNPDHDRIIAFAGFDDMWYNDWIPTDEDNKLIIARINERIAQKPHLYED